MGNCTLHYLYMNCELFVRGTKCESCKQYRCSLRSMSSQQKKMLHNDTSTSLSSHTNYRYLHTPQRKKRMSALKSEVSRRQKEVARLKSKLKETTEKCGVFVEKELEDDLETIMHEKTAEISEKFASGSFQRLFWDQQLEAGKVRDKRRIRWHPMLIRWCLSLKMLSSSSYNALRSSNILVLPSERTLRDYTHSVQAKPGFHSDLNQMLCREAKIDSIPEYQKFVCLVFDEVKVKEDLIYDKHSTSLLSFVKLGSVNDHLSKVEMNDSSDVRKPNLATHVMTFMVSGILSDLEFPYASFPCSALSGDQLYSLVWGCVRRLEACGFKVLAFTCDGASSNRAFLKLHHSNDDSSITYKTTNPYADEDRPIFFISDPPHLIKTVRNCWANSYSHNWTRKLWVSCNCSCMCIVTLLVCLIRSDIIMNYRHATLLL